MSLAAESDAVVEASGSHRTLRTSLVLANWRGRDAEALALIEARREDVLRRGEGLWLAANDWGSAIRYNGLGRRVSRFGWREVLVRRARRPRRRPVPAGAAARDHDEHWKENSSRQFLPS